MIQLWHTDATTAACKTAPSGPAQVNLSQMAGYNVEKIGDGPGLDEMRWMWMRVMMMMTMMMMVIMMKL